MDPCCGRQLPGRRRRGCAAPACGERPAGRFNNLADRVTPTRPLVATVEPVEVDEFDVGPSRRPEGDLTGEPTPEQEQPGGRGPGAEGRAGLLEPFQVGDGDRLG